MKLEERERERTHKKKTRGKDEIEGKK
jgi:hypothetical protein